MRDSVSRRRGSGALALAAGLVVLLVVAVVPDAARGDVLVLKDGRRLEGKVSYDGAGYVVEMKFGSQKIPAADVKEWIRSDDAPPGDGGGSEGADGGDEPASGSSDGDDGDDEDEEIENTEPPEVELPAMTPGERADLQAVLGTGAILLETDHFAIVSTADAEFTKERAGLIERVRTGFYKQFGKRGFPLKRHEKRLEAVIFGDEQSFRKFCARNFPQLGSGAAGFYTTATNRLYFFDQGASPNAKGIERNVEQFKQHLDAIKERQKQAEKAKNWELAKQLSRFHRTERKRLRKFEKGAEDHIDESNESTTIHEAVHQLCYNAGVLVASDRNPQWLVEGLAMLFEDDGFWQGRNLSERNNEIRITTLAQHGKGGGEFMPLGQVVGTSRPLLKMRHPGLAYAQSWALVLLFMKGNFRKYKAKFFDYILAVREQAIEANASGRRDGDADEARLALFEKFFGSVATLQEEYATYVKKLSGF